MLKEPTEQDLDKQQPLKSKSAYTTKKLEISDSSSEVKEDKNENEMGWGPKTKNGNKLYS